MQQESNSEHLAPIPNHCKQQTSNKIQQINCQNDNILYRLESIYKVFKEDIEKEKAKKYNSFEQRLKTTPLASQLSSVSFGNIAEGSENDNDPIKQINSQMLTLYKNVSDKSYFDFQHHKAYLQQQEGQLFRLGSLLAQNYPVSANNISEITSVHSQIQSPKPIDIFLRIVIRALMSSQVICQKWMQEEVLALKTQMESIASRNYQLQNRIKQICEQYDFVKEKMQEEQLQRSEIEKNLLSLQQEIGSLKMFTSQLQKQKEQLLSMSVSMGMLQKKESQDEYESNTVLQNPNSGNYTIETSLKSLLEINSFSNQNKIKQKAAMASSCNISEPDAENILNPNQSSKTSIITQEQLNLTLNALKQENMQLQRENEFMANQMAMLTNQFQNLKQKHGQLLQANQECEQTIDNLRYELQYIRQRHHHHNQNGEGVGPSMYSSVDNTVIEDQSPGITHGLGLLGKKIKNSGEILLLNIQDHTNDIHDQTVCNDIGNKIQNENQNKNDAHISKDNKLSSLCNFYSNSDKYNSQQYNQNHRFRNYSMTKQKSLQSFNERDNEKDKAVNNFNNTSGTNEKSSLMKFNFYENDDYRNRMIADKNSVASLQSLEFVGVANGEKTFYHGQFQGTEGRFRNSSIINSPINNEVDKLGYSFCLDPRKRTSSGLVLSSIERARKQPIISSAFNIIQDSESGFGGDTGRTMIQQDQQKSKSQKSINKKDVQNCDNIRIGKMNGYSCSDNNDIDWNDINADQKQDASNVSVQIEIFDFNDDSVGDGVGDGDKISRKSESVGVVVGNENNQLKKDDEIYQKFAKNSRKASHNIQRKNDQNPNNTNNNTIDTNPKNLFNIAIIQSSPPDDTIAQNLHHSRPQHSSHPTSPSVNRSRTPTTHQLVIEKIIQTQKQLTMLNLYANQLQTRQSEYESQLSQMQDQLQYYKAELSKTNKERIVYKSEIQALHAIQLQQVREDAAIEQKKKLQEMLLRKDQLILQLQNKISQLEELIALQQKNQQIRVEKVKQMCKKYLIDQQIEYEKQMQKLQQKIVEIQQKQENQRNERLNKQQQKEEQDKTSDNTMIEVTTSISQVFSSNQMENENTAKEKKQSNFQKNSSVLSVYTAFSFIIYDNEKENNSEDDKSKDSKEIKLDEVKIKNIEIKEVEVEEVINVEQLVDVIKEIIDQEATQKEIELKTPKIISNFVTDSIRIENECMTKTELIDATTSTQSLQQINYKKQPLNLQILSHIGQVSVQPQPQPQPQKQQSTNTFILLQIVNQIVQFSITGQQCHQKLKERFTLTQSYQLEISCSTPPQQYHLSQPKIDQTNNSTCGKSQDRYIVEIYEENEEKDDKQKNKNKGINSQCELNNKNSQLKELQQSQRYFQHKHHNTANYEKKKFQQKDNHHHQEILGNVTQFQLMTDVDGEEINGDRNIIQGTESIRKELKQGLKEQKFKEKSKEQLIQQLDEYEQQQQKEVVEIKINDQKQNAHKQQKTNGEKQVILSPIKKRSNQQQVVVLSNSSFKEKEKMVQIFKQHSKPSKSSKSSKTSKTKQLCPTSQQQKQSQLKLESASSYFSSYGSYEFTKKHNPNNHDQPRFSLLSSPLSSPITSKPTWSQPFQGYFPPRPDPSASYILFLKSNSFNQTNPANSHAYNKDFFYIDRGETIMHLPSRKYLKISSKAIGFMFKTPKDESVVLGNCEIRFDGVEFAVMRKGKKKQYSGSIPDGRWEILSWRRSMESST